jgi:hypothetical protein
MQERSEEQILSRLFELENTGQADRRVELEGERFISLIQDPDSGRTYVLEHGVDDTEGAEIPEGTEFYEYETRAEAERAFAELLGEESGKVIEQDSEEDLGDSETAGAEVRDRYSDEDTDELVESAEPDEPVDPA